MQHKPYDHEEGWWDKVGRHVSKWIMDDLAHMPFVCENTTEARHGPYWDQKFRQPTGNLLTTDVECTADYFWREAKCHHETPNEYGLPFYQHIWARKLGDDHLAQLFVLISQAIEHGEGFGWMVTRDKVAQCPIITRRNSNYGKDEDSYRVPDHLGKYFELVREPGVKPKWRWWHPQPRTKTPRVDRKGSSPLFPKPAA